jgi:hypothetical protein
MIFYLQLSLWLTFVFYVCAVLPPACSGYLSWQYIKWLTIACILLYPVWVGMLWVIYPVLKSL